MKVLRLITSIGGLILITAGCELGNQPLNYSGDILLQENFEDFELYAGPDELTDWSFIDDYEASNGPSSWFIFDTFNSYYGKALRQESDIGGGGYFGDPTFYGTVALAGDESWTDYSFEVEFYTTDNDGVGFDFRRTDTSGGDSFYRLMLMNDSLNGGPFIKLLYYSYMQGQTVTLAQRNEEAYESSVWNRVKITVIGSSIKCEFNGTTIFDITDARLTHGRIGLFCFCEYGIDFDNIVVTALDEDAPTNGNFIVD
jgi:hypothetical protein